MGEFQFGPDRKTHGPGFDSFAREVAVTSGGEVPTSLGAIASGDISRGRSLATLAQNIRKASRDRGLPINRGSNGQRPTSGADR